MHGSVHGKGWLEVLQEGSGGALSSAQMNPILRSGRPDGRGHGARGLRQGRRRLTEYPVPGGLLDSKPGCA